MLAIVTTNCQFISIFIFNYENMCLVVSRAHSPAHIGAFPVNSLQTIQANSMSSNKWAKKQRDRLVAFDRCRPLVV